MCEFDPRCTGSDDLVGNALAQIATGHWGVTGVYGDELNPAFAYTTGLTEHDRPELVVYGLEPERACGILNRAAELAVADARFLERPTLRGVLQPPYDIVGLPALDTGEMTVTRLLYGPDFAAVQLIWPDAGGRYPWDRGYAYPPGVQPLTGVPRTGAA